MQPQGSAAGQVRAGSAGGARAFPFGIDGPGLEVTQRSRSTVVTCVGAFVLLAMVGSMLALASASFALLSQFTWVFVTLFLLAAYAGYWTCQHQVAWLIFWCLPMLHGLCWLQLVLISFYGVFPGTLWGQAGAHSAQRLLMGQLGTVPLLGVPLAALLAYMWFERHYLFLAFHDFSAQLRKEHTNYNILWYAHAFRLCCRWHLARRHLARRLIGAPTADRARACLRAGTYAVPCFLWHCGSTPSTLSSSPTCHAGPARRRL